VIGEKENGMKRWLLSAALLTFVAALTVHAAPVQVTDSDGDSEIQRFGPKSVPFGAILSTGDLTPGAPGNTDDSQEVFLINWDRNNLRQVTSSPGNSSSVNISTRQLMVVASREDLTPGAPGNTDNSFESYLYNKAKDTLTQMTNTSEDTFFQTFFGKGKGALFVSKGDLTPGAPGNTDGENEVFAYDFDTGQWRQLTNSPYESLVRGISPDSKFAVIQSEGDLTPGAPGNADHENELFIVDLGNGSLGQLTDSTGDTRLGSVSRDGRWIAINSTGDLTPGAPGNTDGGWEAYLYDVKTRRLTQITDSDGDSWFAGFDPRGKRMILQSDDSLDPGGAGNADGSVEIFAYHLKKQTTTQMTASSQDSWFVGYEPRKGKWAAIESSGDLTPGQPGNTDGSQEIFFAKLKNKAKKSKFVQATDGDEDVWFGAWSPKGRFAAAETVADLVGGGNLDGSSEVYLTRAQGKTFPLVQITDSAFDSFVGDFSPDQKNLFVESYGDLDPLGPGNADHSREIFIEMYR
jgi:Tol biopolymer transport system component